jgi:hypothetical protein
MHTISVDFQPAEWERILGVGAHFSRFLRIPRGGFLRGKITSSCSPNSESTPWACKNSRQPLRATSSHLVGVVISSPGFGPFDQYRIVQSDSAADGRRREDDGRTSRDNWLSATLATEEGLNSALFQAKTGGAMEEEVTSINLWTRWQSPDAWGTGRRVPCAQC